MSPFVLAWVDVASNALPGSSPSAVAGESVAGGDPNSFIGHITITLVLIVVGGIAIIMAQSYFGRRRHPPEWVSELEAEQTVREQERTERMTIKGRAPGDDTDAEATRELLGRVAQLRGIGNMTTSAEPVSLADAIASARRAPEKFEEPAEAALTTGSKGPLEATS